MPLKAAPFEILFRAKIDFKIFVLPAPDRPISKFVLSNRTFSNSQLFLFSAKEKFKINTGFIKKVTGCQDF
jgi:hypothetical protein